MRLQRILLIAIIAFGCVGRSVKKPIVKPTPTSLDFQRGEALFNSNTKTDSAFYYFTNVTEFSKDSLLVAMAYTYMAMIQQDVGDHFGSQESALEGLKHLNDKNPEHYYCLSSLYNEVAVSSAGLKNYDLAIEYYELAIKFQQDENYKAIFQNNEAVAYREKGDYRKSIKILESIIEKQKANELDYARSLTNLLSVKSLADTSFYPIPGLLKAMEIRMKEKDDIGLTVSYHHLADYYLSHNKDSALLYAKLMYGCAQRINSTDEKLDALRKLISLSPISESKKHFKLYEFLNDSIQIARNKSKTQFALIKYQSEKNKAENLLLQQDNSKKELKILQQSIWLYSIAATAIIVIIYVTWWLRKKKQQIEWQSQLKIQESHLKTSQKIHDVVANGLYQIMTEIEHKDDIEKERLLDRIDQLYERSRNISYEPAINENSIEDRITMMLASYGTPQTKVSIVGNQESIWKYIAPEVINEVEFILQELMVNMAKHSGANYVVIRFENQDHTLNISYRDDGIGFQPGVKHGNGLKSTENRIHKINGKIIFTKESSAGASIKIVIPIKRR